MSVIDEHLSFLRSVEASARDRISQVSLVAELGVDSVVAKNSLRLHVMAHRLYDHTRGRRFNEDYPLSLVVGLVDIAQRLYERGGLWPYINEELKAVGLRNDLDQLTQKAFREVFTETLKRYNLRTAGEGNEMVDTAAMHAGIPTGCLSDWFDLTRRARLGVGDSPAAMTEWALRHRTRPALAHIAMPIKRMLEAGPEFAQELFERSSELVDGLADGFDPVIIREVAKFEATDGLDHPAGDFARKVGLSPRWSVMACRHLTTSAPPARTVGTRAVRNAQPQVYLDFEQGQLRIQLPAIPDVDSSVDWHLSIGQETAIVRADIDTSGSVVATHPVDYPILTPLQSVGILVGDQRLDIALWPSDGFSAFFDLQGRLQRLAGGVLAPSPKWVLMPEDASLKLEGSTVQPIAEDDPPSGWHGWTLRQYVLRPHQNVIVTRGQEVQHVRVRGGESPVFHPAPPVSGARHYGWPVSATRPTVQLPPDSGQWTITVSRRGAPTAIWTREASGGESVAILDGEHALVGDFSVRVRGPLGRGIEEQFVLIDGLSFTNSPPIRRIGADGRLSACSVRAAGSVGITMLPASAEIPSERSSEDFVASTPDGSDFSIRYFPPTTLIALENSQGIPRWGPRSVRIDPADLNTLKWLHVKVPPGVPTPMLHAIHRRQVVQRLAPEKSMASLRFSLTELADTARTHPELRLFLDDEQPVGLVKARPMISSMRVSPDGSHLEFEVTAGTLDELEIWCWLADAPWRPPVLLRPEQDRAELPEAFRISGPLQVHTRQADEWVELDPPSREVRKTLVEAPGAPRLNPNEARVVAVAQGEPRQLLEPSDASTALDVLGSGPYLGSADSRGATRRISEALTGIGSDLLVELSRRQPSNRDLEESLVRTGFYCKAPQLEASECETVWRNSATIGAIFALDAIALQDGELDGETRVEEACREFGDIFLELLEAHSDPSAEVGRFDQQALIFESLPELQRKQIVKGMGLVPRGLLTPDARILRATALSMGATQPGAQFPQFRDLTLQVQKLLANCSDKHLTSDLEALRPGGGATRHHWAPPFARATALLARTIARNETDATFPPHLHKALVELTKVAPLMFLSELVRTEALLHAPSHAQTLTTSNV